MITLMYVLIKAYEKMVVDNKQSPYSGNLLVISSFFLGLLDRLFIAVNMLEIGLVMLADTHPQSLP